ncbi:hypothetical protein FRC14_007649 [Serendipita sp. 396]|nr:hypothetical protein FRC14_007649 [Serendipita sp. 396]KAG8780087.1 hypothetical protein FRC15_009756 [Serendipita sp. 397]KAG8799968.1 hypothetical protein FRC16_004000 [Serendipita sp. 398]KAG8816708.1 hypothetical protein FRC18_000876 [Serendipita sp. 400]KAG8855004.1 hypothetical protein FRC20_000865 [Serendipita sp. 405]
MERQGALHKILEIAAVGRNLLSSRASTSPQPQPPPAQPTPPSSRRRLVPPKLPFPRSKQLRPRLHQLGVPSTASQRLSQAYRRRVLALSQTVRVELKDLWRNIAANPRYSDTAVKEKYTLSATAILRHYEESLSTSFESAIVAVKAHFNIRESPTVNGRFDERYVCLLEWAFEYNRYPSQEEKSQMALNSGLSYRQISVWFQNRRSRVKRKEQEYLEALARGETPTPLPVRRFRLPPPPVFFKGRSELPEPQTSPEENDPERFLHLDISLPTTMVPSVFDTCKNPKYAYPRPMEPREWDIPTFEAPKSWPRQDPEISDQFHLVHPGEVQLLYRQLKMMTVEPTVEDPDILDMVNDYHGVNVEVSSDSESDSDDNADPEAENAADDEAEAENGDLDAPIQVPFTAPTFAEHIASRAITTAATGQDDSEEPELLPPGDYVRMRNPRVRRNRIRRPPLRRDPDSSDGEQEDLQGEDESEDDMEIEEQNSEWDGEESTEVVALGATRDEQALSADESDDSQSGSSQAHSDLPPIDPRISTQLSWIMDSHQPDGLFLPDKPLEIPECFNQTFSTRIAEEALEQTLKQLGIPAASQQPATTVFELPSYSWDSTWDSTTDMSLITLTEQDSTSMTVRVGDYNRSLLEDYYTIEKPEKIRKRTRAEKLHSKLVRRAQRQRPVPPPLESLTFANLADYDHPYFPPVPSLEECQRMIEAEQDPMRFLTFEHHQEPEDYHPLPSIIANSDCLPAPPPCSLPAIVVTQEHVTTQSEPSKAVPPSQQPTLTSAPRHDLHLPPQPQPPAGGTENRPEEPQALLGRLLNLLTAIPRSVWDSLGFPQRSADEPRQPLIPFDPEVMFEIPETNDDIESIFPPLQLPNDLYPPLDPQPEDFYAVTDDGSTIPALW